MVAGAAAMAGAMIGRAVKAQNSIQEQSAGFPGRLISLLFNNGQNVCRYGFWRALKRVRSGSWRILTTQCFVILGLILGAAPAGADPASGPDTWSYWMGRARLFAPLEFSEWFLTPPDFVGRSGGLPAFDEPAAAASSAPNVRADPLSRPAACRQMRIREAAPGSGWSLAGPHRIPQRQGVHFFPFGCLFDSGTLPTDRYLDDVRDAGFNGVLIEPGSMEGSVTNMLRAAQARHLWVNALVPDDPDSVPPGPQVWPASTLAWFSAEWEEGADPHWVPPQEQRCRA